MSPFGAFGLRRLLDANQRFTAAGLPVYLRVKNFQENVTMVDAEEVGLSFTPTVTGAITTGTTDILIDPPPEITIVSMHNLGMAAAAGVALKAGARTITISHTWVAARQAQMGYNTPQQVFNDKSVTGIVTDNLLLEPVDITHPDDAFDEIISWRLLCNCSELSSS